MATTTVLHEPRLDTILMVEREIQRTKSYSTKKELWQSLPRKLQYQTFNRILDYLESSNKILLDRAGSSGPSPVIRDYEGYSRVVSDCASILAIPEPLLVLFVSQEYLQHNDDPSTFL